MGSHQFNFHYGRPAGKYQETCDHRGRSSGEDLRPRSLREGCVRRGAVQADRLPQRGEEDPTPDKTRRRSKVSSVEHLWAKEAKLEALRDAPKLLVGLKADLK